MRTLGRGSKGSAGVMRRLWSRLEYFYPGVPAALAPELGVDAELGADVLLKLI